MIQLPIKVGLNVQSNVVVFDMGVYSTNEVIDLECSTVINASGFPAYDGPFTFTPTEETQIIQTENKTTYQNIVINPIPNNYGRVEYNGVRIKIS